jgi:hypothetical protein
MTVPSDVRPEVIQECYDMLRATRTLRKEGFTMVTAGKLGMAHLYAEHGSKGLIRWLELAVDAALHNAELDGITPTQPKNEVN